MSLQKSEAFVLRSIKYGETSKILTLNSRSFGKLSVIAKGARGKKSKFGASLEPANYISILFYRKENRDLQILSDSEIIDAFPGARTSLAKTSYLMAICESINQVEKVGEANSILFKLQLRAQKCIELDVTRPQNIFRAFMVKLLDVIGFEPDFKQCHVTGESALTDIVFDFDRGRYRITGAGTDEASGMRLTKEVLSLLRFFQEVPLAKLQDVKISQQSAQLIDDFLISYLQYHVDGFRELKALYFIEKVRRSIPG